MRSNLGKRYFAIAILPFVSCFLISCGESPTLYTIGGTVLNLVGGGGGLVLQNNGADDLLVNANGSFAFKTAVMSGSSYNVTVKAQPNAPVQTCGVTSATGTASAGITTVVVDCGHNEWTWVTGANVANQGGTYGTLGTADVGNIPGARSGAVGWTDAAGNFWLFGGDVSDSTGKSGSLNDLWKYSGGQWIWMGGSNIPYQTGTYGSQGMASASNVPGARSGAMSWTDAAGNFWLYGGGGSDSIGIKPCGLNDLWKYSAGQWTWMGGSNIGNQKGVYGTLGTAAAANFPGARSGAVSWTDAGGNFWLFGGDGVDPVSGCEGRNSLGMFFLAVGAFNDLWKYSAGQWTWMGGSNMIGQKGTYGSQGMASASNVPGARDGAMSWTDAAGNFWLFGGAGYDSTGKFGSLNDLWKYSGGQWIWMGGSNMIGQKGTYGTLGTADVGNIPGARDGAVSLTDTAGNFWLYGGADDWNSTGSPGPLNDLWKYSGGQWVWMSGSNAAPQNQDHKGMYGTRGTPAPGNAPGARRFGVSWTDKTGNFWLFGGVGYDSTGTSGLLNDLWKYEP